MNINKFIKEYSSNKPLKSPTPNCKLYNSNRLKTIFYTLADAITEGKKWETEDTPFPTITLESNGYYRFYGHGNYAYKNRNYYDA
jgi:hypothetical protein